MTFASFLNLMGLCLRCDGGDAGEMTDCAGRRGFTTCLLPK
jgi:hypothetical protein